MRRLGAEDDKHTAWRNTLCGSAVLLTIAACLVAVSAVAQPANPNESGASPQAVPADGRDYVIPFMVLTDIETDFSLAPPPPDDNLRDASTETIDALFDSQQAKK